MKPCGAAPLCNGFRPDASVRQPGILRAGEPQQVVRGKLHLRADFPGADADGVKELGRLVDERREGFFHAQRAAPAVDVAGGGQQQLLREHLHGLLPAGGRGAAQVERLWAGDHEDVERAAFALGDERLEHGVRRLPQHARDGHGVQRAVRGIQVHLMGDARPIEDAHHVGLVSHGTALPFKQSGHIVAQPGADGKRAFCQMHVEWIVKTWYTGIKAMTCT